MRILFFFLILFSFQLFSHAQPPVMTISPPTGTANYSPNGFHTIHTSGPGTKRFFLFDDGCYNFNGSLNTRHYNQSSIGYNPIAYFLVPYDPDPPTRASASTQSVTTPGFQMLNYSMPTNPHVGTSWDPSNSSYNYYILKVKKVYNRENQHFVTFYYNSADVTPDGTIIDSYRNWFGIKDYTSNVNPQFDRQITWPINFNEDSIAIAYIPLKCINGPGHNFKIGSKYNNNSIVIKNFVQQGTPHDPNSIHADRDCFFRNHMVDENGKLVSTIKNNYHVEFQNEGTGPANTVRVLFELGLNSGLKLDGLSANVIKSEYPFTIHKTESKVEVVFERINLPGLLQTYPKIPAWDETKGWFDISFCNLGELNINCDNDAGSIISNCCINLDAKIFFDWQPPVSTNTSTTCIMCTNEQKRDKYEACAPKIVPPIAGKRTKTQSIGDVIPNPALSSISLSLDSEITNANINIYNSLGAIVKNLNYTYLADDTQIDVQDLAPGFYKIAVKGSGEVLEFKFVKL